MNHQRTAILGAIFSFTLILSACSSSSGGGASSGTPTATLSASPSTIATGQGQYATLTFGSTNADQGSINNGIGPVGASGSIKVSPTATTTYTFTATGQSASATAQATVTVSKDPAVTITANPNAVALGSSTTLTVTATSASQVVITDNNDSNVYTLSGSGGTQVVKPTGGTTYVATATGANGSTATASVTVPIVPTATISASTPALFATQPVTIAFSSTYASGATLNGVAVPISGSLVEYPSQTTTYTFVVSGAGGTTTASTTVLVPGLSADLANLGQDSQPSSQQYQQQDVDPNGSVGTKQFLEYINIQYQAYDKTTLLPIWSSPQMIGTPWTAINNLNGDTGLSEDCDGHILGDGTLSGIHLDAVIDFDRLASRWVVMGRGDLSDDYVLCLAVSNTDDLSSPTLGWYSYEIDLRNVVGHNLSGDTYFPDWPKLGIWSDGYYVTMDLEDVDNNYAEVGVAACVFDRNDILLQGTASAPGVLYPTCGNPTPSLTLSSSGTYLGHSLIPADIEGTTPPPSGLGEYMISIQNPDISQTPPYPTESSSLNLWATQLVWGSVTSPGTLTLTPTLFSVNTYTPGCYLFQSGAPAYTNCVPEQAYQGQIQVTDSVGDRLMPRFAYRNFGAYESYLVSQTVEATPNPGGTPASYQTAVAWYELRDNGTGTPSLNQQGLINPDNVLYRFLPSIAQDHNGNAAVGYSFSNGLNNPGIAYSYWNLDTSNATPTEVTLLDGPGEELTGIATGTPGEWGTYSSMTVDPVDDCTFWYVNEFYPTNSVNSWTTFIGSFQLSGCQ
jgi:hypothetical protein